MNTNKILGLLLLVLVLLIALPKMMPEKKGYPETFASMDTSKVSRLLISKAGEAVELQRKNGSWMVMDPLEWAADSRNLDRLLAELPTFGAVALVNANKGGEADARYELDDMTATRLQVFEGDRQVLALRLGKASQDFATGFVRYEDKDAIYRSASNMSSRVPATSSRWLDKVIYKEEQENLAGIELIRDAGTLRFANQDSAWAVEWMPASGKGWNESGVNEAAFSGVRNGLQTLRMSEFATDGQAQQLADAPVALGCLLQLKDGRSRRVNWYRLADEENKVFCRVDDKGPWFSLYKSSLERLEGEASGFRPE